MTGHSLHIWAEAQQAHEKVQEPLNKYSQGEATLQQHEGCVSLGLKEEEKAQEEEVPWSLATRL